MDHDRMFKELLSTCFVEFVDLFLPSVAGYIDRDVALSPLDKELIGGVAPGNKREADLVMRVKFRDRDVYFLIHVESQAKSEANFSRRMFRYFARLSEKYDLPIYPVVIYSHRAPAVVEQNRYDVEFPDLVVLQFKYVVIQLNQLPWRQFIDSENPIACALMARMKMTREERPKVKLECLRLLASLKVDPAKSTLIGRFISAYLQLNAEELIRFEREIDALAPTEKETTMALVSEWEQKGIDKGIAFGIERGKEDLIAIQIRQRFGAVPGSIVTKLDRLTSVELDDLGKELLTFTCLDDLTQWLLRRG